MIDQSSTSESYWIWEDLQMIYENRKKYGNSHDKIGEFICDTFELHPEHKDEIYNKTLEWVNEIRTNQMKDQESLNSLMPGNEMQSESCTIANSLDKKYETAVGDNILRDRFGEYVAEGVELPTSDGLTWYAEWVSKSDDDDWGFAKLPWFAFILAKGFDYGAFPELTNLPYEK